MQVIMRRDQKQLLKVDRIILKVMTEVVDRLRKRGCATELAEYPMSFGNSTLFDELDRYHRMQLFGIPTMVNYQRDYKGERIIKVLFNPPDYWPRCPDTVGIKRRKGEKATILFIWSQIVSGDQIAMRSIQGSDNVREAILNFRF